MGDDSLTLPFPARIAAALWPVARRIPVRFMHGNRDFLVARGFCASTGVALVEDPTIVDLYGTRTLLLHGDTLCTDDHAYQAFRRQARDPRWQGAMLARPLAERRALAKAARAESARHMAGLSAELMDVNAEAVREAFRTHGVRRMIHGHTHRPAVHELDIDGQRHTRVVLADWYGPASMLRVAPSGIAQVPL